MGCLCPNPHFLPGLVSQKDTLLGLIGSNRVHTRDTRCVARCRIDSKSSIDIPSRLVEFDGLPSIFSRLTDTRTVGHSWLVDCIARMGLILIGILSVDITLDLILAEAQG